MIIDAKYVDGEIIYLKNEEHNIYFLDGNDNIMSEKIDVYQFNVLDITSFDKYNLKYIKHKYENKYVCVNFKDKTFKIIKRKKPILKSNNFIVNKKILEISHQNSLFLLKYNFNLIYSTYYDKYKIFVDKTINIYLKINNKLIHLEIDFDGNFNINENDCHFNDFIPIYKNDKIELLFF